MTQFFQSDTWLIYYVFWTRKNSLFTLAVLVISTCTWVEGIYTLYTSSISDVGSCCRHCCTVELLAFFVELTRFTLDVETLLTGAPNNVFFLNSLKTLFKAIEGSFRSPEMHSQRRYKICICSVILGHLESFRNFEGLSIIFPKILDAI